MRLTSEDTGTWAGCYASVIPPRPFPVLAGFNANIDRVIPVTPALLKILGRQSGPGFEELRTRLNHSMRYCAADEMVIRSPERYDAVYRFFARRGRPALGGQAGIAAVRLRQLGFGPVTCVVPGAGRKTRALLEAAGITPCIPGAGTIRQPDRIHFVLEHAPGLVPLAPGTVPRNNRFIVSPAHDPSTVLIPANAEEPLRAEIAACRRAFLCGYQYLATEKAFSRAARQLARIRTANPAMRTHVECVGGVLPRVLERMARLIFPHADSIGLNEQELAAMARVLAVRDAPDRSGPSLSPAGQVRISLAVARTLGISRLHLHTFGYYVLVLEPGTGQPLASRDALLLAAREASAAAGGDRRFISPEGLMAYAAIRTAYGPDEPAGIFQTGDRTVIAVPACISLPARRTTGLGDIISSVAFAADPF